MASQSIQPTLNIGRFAVSQDFVAQGVLPVLVEQLGVSVLALDFHPPSRFYHVMGYSKYFIRTTTDRTIPEYDIKLTITPEGKLHSIHVGIPT